jgi:hypothetical protein
MTLLFDNPIKISKASTNLGIGRTLNRAKRTEVKENKADRIRALQAEGCIVKRGGCGATVFNLGARDELRSDPRCKYCGRSMERQRSTKQFCSDKCRVYASRMTLA